MATSYTSLLGFALPVTGELDGTWGTTVNNSITELVEDSIAATATASVASGDWTLSTTGAGATNEARCAILIPTGSPGVSRNIIAPSQSKAYIVINQSNAAVVLKGSATTGVTITAGVTSLVAWNGSDFVEVGQAGDVDGPSSATDNAVTRFDGTTGRLLQNSVVTISDTGDIAGAGSITSTSSSGVLTRAAATQDGIELIGRAGGTSSYKVTFTPATLTASRTLTIPNASGTILQSGTAVTVAQGGTGNTTIPGQSIFVANALDTLTALSPSAGQSIRVNAGSTAWEAYTPTGSGDVEGPASSTDNAVVRFDGTSGKFIQNSGVLVDDSNNVTIPGQADLRLADADSSNYIALQSPAVVASNVTFTLPSADGTSGQLLQTDGSGTLSFVTVSTTAVGSTLYLNNVYGGF